MVHIGRNIALYFLVAFPIYGLTGALVNLASVRGPGFHYWSDVTAWLLVGWVFPFLFLPAALLLMLVAARLPSAWSRSRRRVATMAVAVAFFATGLLLLARGDMRALISPAVFIACVPALAYGAVLRLPERPAVDLHD